jgi:ABC-type molybdate transport system substrate-binding protein
MSTARMRPVLAIAALALLAAPVAQAAPETVEIFSAGSLREV